MRLVDTMLTLLKFNMLASLNFRFSHTSHVYRHYMYACFINLQASTYSGPTKFVFSAQEIFAKRYTFTVTKEKETEIEVPFEFLSKEEMANDHNMTELLV